MPPTRLRPYPGMRHTQVEIPPDSGVFITRRVFKPENSGLSLVGVGTVRTPDDAMRVSRVGQTITSFYNML